jgi:hypothetical protein
MDQPTSKFWPSFDALFKSGGFIKDNPEVNGLSICSVMLEMYFGDQILATGTGWFWRLSDGIALVTAWHNFSGLHHTIRKPISRYGGIPDRVRYRYMARSPQTFQDAEIPLYLDNDRTQPRWFVHPTCGSYLDMAFLGLQLIGGEVACVNDNVPVMQTSGRPGYDVFAVGYPQGVRTVGVLPVWKRGTISSDPDIPVEGLPKFYVDMAGRGGLSGAPVYRVQQGMVVNETATGQSAGIGDQVEFLGLYSGRAADQLPPNERSGESTDLGFVWHAKYVEEMLAGGVLDEQPEVGKGALTITEIWHKPGDVSD